MPAGRKVKEENESNDNVKELVKTIIIFVIVIGGTFGGYYIFKAAMGTEMPIVVVVSPSMEPQIHEGDLLFVKYKDPADIQSGTHENLEGDVIIYDTHGVWDDPVEYPVVHRVVNKWYDDINDIWYFNAHGDNNNYPDPPDESSVTADIPDTKIIGVVVGRIPYIGLISMWLESTGMAVPIMVILGFILVISIVYDYTHPEEEETKDKDERSKYKEVRSKTPVSSAEDQGSDQKIKKDEEFDLGL
ncbi:MAG: signal peptidase I [Candidatus Lokiarchaeota archaeon]|nr:signal peptidase I [Candidatus Lokiarchaeota archaeon]